ncbi:MAG TPA: hypothetical protein VFD32_14205, partial [Dehalococcoidia bacterium]|nr:hypothetical protein [Dehalococcoidia bacterium]
ARTRARVAPALSELHFVWAFTEVAFAGPVPRPSARNPEVPAWLDEVVMRGLARDPAQRFQSGREFAAALASGRLPSGPIVAPSYDTTLVDRPAPLRAPIEPTVVDLYTPRIVEARPGGPAAQPAQPGAVEEAASASAVSAEPWVLPSSQAEPHDEPVLYAAPPTWAQPGRPSGDPEPAVADQSELVIPVPMPAGFKTAAESPEPVRETDMARGYAAGPPHLAGATDSSPAARRSSGRGKLWLIVLAALLLLAVGGAAGFALAQRSPSKSARSPQATLIATAPSPASPASATAVAAAATAATATTASAAGTTSTPASTARSPGTPNPAGVPEVATLLRPGASAVKQVRVPAAGTAEQLVVYSQATGSDGCVRPYLDVYRPDAGGTWASAWDATRQPSADKPLLQAPKRDGERCFPVVEFFDVRPLVNGGASHVVASIVVDVEGRRRLIDFGLADATKAVALDFDLTTTPTAAPPEFTEGLPQSLRVSQNAYAPQSSGVNGGYGKPIGTLDSLLRWDEATQTFKPISQQLTLNCTKGTISALGRAAVQIQCDDGRYSAVAVDGKTSYGPGGAFADLRTGESVGIGVAPSSLAPADPLNALPVATAVLRER